MKAQVISFRCVLRNKFGQILSSTTNRDVMTQSPDDDGAPLKALAEGLQNLSVGERRSISLRADQAYGFYDPQLAVTRSRDELFGAESLRVGDRVEIHRPSSEKIVYRVVALTADTVVLDANHPLAGLDLIFEIETLDARDATPEDWTDMEVESEVDSEVAGGIEAPVAPAYH